MVFYQIHQLIVGYSSIWYFLYIVFRWQICDGILNSEIILDVLLWSHMIFINVFFFTINRLKTFFVVNLQPFTVQLRVKTASNFSIIYIIRIIINEQSYIVSFSLKTNNSKEKNNLLFSFIFYFSFKSSSSGKYNSLLILVHNKLRGLIKWF